MIKEILNSFLGTSKIGFLYGLANIIGRLIIEMIKNGF
jgi:hypothetical protein